MSGKGVRGQGLQGQSGDLDPKQLMAAEVPAYWVRLTKFEWLVKTPQNSLLWLQQALSDNPIYHWI